jgi:hypothetical protein
VRRPKRTEPMYVEGLERLRTKLGTCFSIRLMAEMAHAREDHSHAMFIRGLNHFRITN